MNRFVRLVPILLAAPVLMAADCSKTVERYITDFNALGTSPAPQAAALYVAPPSAVPVVESSSSEEVVTVAVVEPEVVPEPEPVVVEPPAPPPCDDWTWRGRVFDCHGNWLYDQ